MIAGEQSANRLTEAGLFARYIAKKAELAAAPAASSPPLHNLPWYWNQAFAGPADAVVTVAAAWRLLYTCLSLLDDLEDGDFSAGKWAMTELLPDAALKFPPAALNVSTGLIAQTGLLLAGLGEDDLPAGAASDIQQAFFRTLLAMTQGQHGDLTLKEPTLDEAWQICVAKSGLWFRLGCWAGARTVTAADDRLAQAATFGENLGLLIQLGDDLTDLWGGEDKQSDLLQGERWSLPVAYSMSVLPAADRAHLATLLASAGQDRDAEAAARNIVIQSGAPLFLSVKAKSCRAQAEAALSAAGLSAAAAEPLMALLAEHDLVP
ncbi:MAG: polyprenyl synthetase family protein [Anaerolineales bacterium]|nr:polyprenyl synthetase family protein [Anaerolineales bacterium]